MLEYNGAISKIIFKKNKIESADLLDYLYENLFSAVSGRFKILYSNNPHAVAHKKNKVHVSLTIAATFFISRQ